MMTRNPEQPTTEDLDEATDGDARFGERLARSLGTEPIL